MCSIRIEPHRITSSDSHRTERCSHTGRILRCRWYRLGPTPWEFQSQNWQPGPSPDHGIGSFRHCGTRGRGCDRFETGRSSHGVVVRRRVLAIRTGTPTTGSRIAREFDPGTGSRHSRKFLDRVRQFVRTLVWEFSGNAGEKIPARARWHGRHRFHGAAFEQGTRRENRYHHRIESRENGGGQAVRGRCGDQLHRNRFRGRGETGHGR
mmetsp:Transcript_26956/g.56468  ORF Transcript_26956/g.56468 Transcript_26956/m.56468 type:complete len:208 (-) Transcript_26956:162-785(-)